MMVRWLQGLETPDQHPLEHMHSATWWLTDPNKPAQPETQPPKAMRAFHATLFQETERLSDHVGLRQGLVNKVDMYHDTKHGCLLLEPEHERLCFDTLKQSNRQGDVVISTEAAQPNKLISYIIFARTEKVEWPISDLNQAVLNILQITELMVIPFVCLVERFWFQRIFGRSPRPSRRRRQRAETCMFGLFEIRFPAVGASHDSATSALPQSLNPFIAQPITFESCRPVWAGNL